MARGDINISGSDWSDYAGDTGGEVFSADPQVSAMRERAAQSIGPQREPEEDEDILSSILGSTQTGGQWGMATSNPYVGIAAGGVDFLNRMGIFD